MTKATVKKNLFKIHGRCKVCKFSSLDEKFFAKIHKLRFQENYSLPRLVEAINAYIKKKDYDIDLVNPMNLSTHFKKHIPADLQAQYIVQTKKQSITKTVTEQDNVPNSIKKVGQEIVEDRVNAYTSLEDLYLTLTKRFADYDAAECQEIDNDNYVSYVAVTKELRTCLTELNKMKQSEQITRLILQTAFQEYTSGTLRGIIEELDKFKQGLRSYIKDQDTIERLVDGIKIGIGEHVSRSSKIALDAVRTEFKIK